MGDQTIYEETQRLHHNTIVRYLVPLSCLFSIGLAMAVLMAQKAPASAIGLTMGLGLGVPLALAWLPMRVVVTERAITVRSLFLFGKTIAMDSIVEARDLRYNPLLDCGGWGAARPSRKYGIVYNIAGDRGVHIVYDAGNGERSVLIGSRRSDELERAIRVAANLPGVSAIHGAAPA